MVSLNNRMFAVRWLGGAKLLHKILLMRAAMFITGSIIASDRYGIVTASGGAKNCGPIVGWPIGLAEGRTNGVHSRSFPFRDRFAH